MASVFCVHGKVKTICAECKPKPAAPPQAPMLPSGAAPGVRPEAEDVEPAAQPARGPGKPLMPLRRRVRKATRAEAENAEAWWVRRK